MTVIKVTDFKGDNWALVYTRPQKYLHKGDCFWKVWYYASVRPKELKNYSEVPIPIFTDWWPYEFSIESRNKSSGNHLE